MNVHVERALQIQELIWHHMTSCYTKDIELKHAIIVEKSCDTKVDNPIIPCGNLRLMNALNSLLVTETGLHGAD